MYVLFVKVQVKPENREAYLKATIDLDAKGSTGDEPGCYRFDVLADETDPNTIYFYEVYQDKDAFQAHIKAPHFAKWQAATAGLTIGPSQVVRAFSAFPADADWRRQGI